MVLGLTRHLSHSVHNQAWGNSFGSGRQVLGQSGVAGFPTSGREDGLEGPLALIGGGFCSCPTRRLQQWEVTESSGVQKQNQGSEHNAKLGQKNAGARSQAKASDDPHIPLPQDDS